MSGDPKTNRVAIENELKALNANAFGLAPAQQHEKEPDAMTQASVSRSELLALLQRRENIAVNALSSERARKLNATLDKIEKQLVAFGEPAPHRVPPVPEDAPPAEMNNYLEHLERLLEQCRPVYEWHRQQREAAQRAAETPEQRELRDLRERLAELEARSANMSSSPRHQTDPMPYCASSNLLTPPPSFGMAPAGPPPQAARAVRGAARRIGHSEIKRTQFAMPGVSDQIGEVSMPHDFIKACR